MYIPTKAIILAPTREDAQRLLSFLFENGYTWHNGNADPHHTGWNIHAKETCYNLEPARRLCYADSAWYQEMMDQYDAHVEEEYLVHFIPEDPTLRLISVDDFISLCTEEDIVRSFASLGTTLNKGCQICIPSRRRVPSIAVASGRAEELCKVFAKGV